MGWKSAFSGAGGGRRGLTAGSKMSILPFFPGAVNGCRESRAGASETLADLFRSVTLARWQSGHAADCNSAYAGSIPTRASNSP